MTKKLATGMRAPQFTAVDVFGKKVTLSSNKDRYTLVVFLRYAGCPWCNLALHRLAMEQQLLKESRCDIIAFIQSSKENMIVININLRSQLFLIKQKNSINCMMFVHRSRHSRKVLAKYRIGSMRSKTSDSSRARSTVTG